MGGGGYGREKGEGKGGGGRGGERERGRRVRSSGCEGRPITFLKSIRTSVRREVKSQDIAAWLW
jgi:hypothetical protein